MKEQNLTLTEANGGSRYGRCIINATEGQNSIEQHKSGEARPADHADGIDLKKLCTHERCDEQPHADPEMPRVHGRQREVVWSHKQQGCSSKQAHDGGTQAHEHPLHGVGLHVTQEQACYENHQDERRQDKSRCCGNTAEHRHEARKASVMGGGVATIGCRVDADGTRRHLTYCHDVRKLGRCEPMMSHHGLCLYERQHAVTSSKAEETNLEECEKKL